MAAVIVVRLAVHHGASIPHQIRAPAYRLLKLLPILRVLLRAADDGRSVLQNSKEVFTANAMIFRSLHHKGSAGNACGHIIKIRIDPKHGTVVFHIAVRIVRIGMPLLGGFHLVRHPGHGPAGTVIFMIVCVDMYILPAQVNGCRIEYHLLFIGSEGIGDILIDPRGQRGGSLRKYGIIRIFRFLRICRIHRVYRIHRCFAAVIARKPEQIVRKGIAAGQLQTVMALKIRQAVGCLQCLQKRVAGVELQHLCPDILFRLCTAQTVLEEIVRPLCVCQGIRKVILHQSAEASAPGKVRVDHIVGIQVTIEIRGSKRVLHMVEAIVIGPQIPGPDRRRQCVHVRLRQIHAVRNLRVHRAEHHIRRISGPAAQVRSGQLHALCHALHGGIAGNIHGAEHMAQIHGIAIGQLHLFQIFQPRCPCAVLGVLLRHIGCKIGILRTGHGFPGAGGIPRHPGTDKVDDQGSGILLGIRLRIGGSIGLQLLQMHKERIIVRNGLLLRYLLCFRFGFLRCALRLWLRRRYFLGWFFCLRCFLLRSFRGFLRRFFRGFLRCFFRGFLRRFRGRFGWNCLRPGLLRRAARLRSAAFLRFFRQIRRFLHRQLRSQYRR